VRHAINTKHNEPFRDFFLHYDHERKGNRPKIFSGMAIEINFRAMRKLGRERGTKAASISSLCWIAIFFLLISASLNIAAIFSHRNATFYKLCTRHIGPSVYPSNCTLIRQELTCFARQRNWISAVYGARNCVLLSARTYVPLVLYESRKYRSWFSRDISRWDL